MLVTKTRMLMRLLPRLGLNSSVVQSMQASSLPASVSRSQGTLVSHLSSARPAVMGRGSNGLFVPRRTLAGGSKEDYILHQNTLTETEKKDIEDSVKKDFEDWVPYGFCPTDKEEDIYRYKLFLFTTITVGSVIFLYIWFHLPPKNMREWVSREAYLEIERRQRLGLPLVDRNLIPADRVLLPSQEELGDDYEIII